MTVSSTWRLGCSYLCLGVGWRSGVPCVDLVEVSTTIPTRVPLVGQFLGFQVPSSLRYCTGRYAFAQESDTVHVPCPTHAQADKGGQCAECASRDDFRFAHHFHTGGHAPDALVRYMQQPHWVYIATFADGTSKVGTAASQRLKSRLDEQGAVVATCVAGTADGRIARNVEDAITRECDVAQTKSRLAKLSALAAPLPVQQLEKRHNELLDSVLALVESLALMSTGLRSLRTRWELPDEAKAILAAAPMGGWP
ncbi:DUF2797 domain-containing protein, partial [Streptomyces sp. NPDC057456]|uniref:DUF2797 domain-containing protein n=1 Tax=Streptomyces sp. NPDC057456 TaxID=3346139 RepID=UPI0036986773